MASEDNTIKSKRLTLLMWWQPEKENISQGETLDFLQDNKDRLEKALESIYDRSLIYRSINIVLAFFVVITNKADQFKDFVAHYFLKIPPPHTFKEHTQSEVNAVNFKKNIGFLSTNKYLLKKTLQSRQSIQLINEIIGFGKAYIHYRAPRKLCAPFSAGQPYEVSKGMIDIFSRRGFKRNA